MDNLPNQQPNLNLPPAGAEKGPTVADPESSPDRRPEGLSNPETAPGQSFKAAPPLMPVLPKLDNTTPQFAITQDDQTGHGTIPVLSDESRDLIAKEWITRAKRIVEQTRGDPHKQSQEFNKLKAEYVKQRYNMTIKVNDE